MDRPPLRTVLDLEEPTTSTVLFGKMLVSTSNIHYYPRRKKNRRSKGDSLQRDYSQHYADNMDDMVEDEELQEDDDTLEEMKALGLPTSFVAGAQGRARRDPQGGVVVRLEEGEPLDRDRLPDHFEGQGASMDEEEDEGGYGDEGESEDWAVQQEAHEWVTRHLQDLTVGEGSGRRGENQGGNPSSTGGWIQALDASSGYYYYYNEALQETRWEPPENEEFVPWQGAPWVPPHPQPASEDPPPLALSTRERALGVRERPETSGLLPAGFLSSAPPGSHTRFDGESGMDEVPEGVGAVPSRALVEASGLEDEQVVVKYWLQRTLLFHRFSKGVRLDREGWFSATPEPIARHQALRMGTAGVIDGFCGVGGNAIQFARAACSRVTAVDLDAKRLELACHNAAIYEVAEGIEFVHEDFFQLHRRGVQGDVVFLSPPWGGPEYSLLPVYSLELDLALACAGRGFADLLRYSASLLRDGPRDTESARGLAVFLPKNTDLEEVLRISGEAVPQLVDGRDRGGVIEVERNVLNGRIKGITVYLGQFLSGGPGR